MSRRSFATCPRCKRDVQTVFTGKATRYDYHDRPGTRRRCMPSLEEVTTATWLEPEVVEQPFEKLTELPVDGPMNAAIEQVVSMLNEGQAIVLINGALRVTVRRRGDQAIVEAMDRLMPKKLDGVTLF
jgi:hypothetical protein